MAEPRHTSTINYLFSAFFAVSRLGSIEVFW
jgi:hypothetical protein